LSFWEGDTTNRLNYPQAKKKKEKKKMGGTHREHKSARKTDECFQEESVTTLCGGVIYHAKKKKKGKKLGGLGENPQFEEAFPHLKCKVSAEKRREKDQRVISPGRN